MSKEKQFRSRKTKTVIQNITGKRVVDMLPDSDKAAIMNWLLQMPLQEINKLANDVNTPAFVVKCANMLNDEPLERYFDLMHSCQFSFKK